MLLLLLLCLLEGYFVTLEFVLEAVVRADDGSFTAHVVQGLLKGHPLIPHQVDEDEGSGLGICRDTREMPAAQ